MVLWLTAVAFAAPLIPLDRYDVEPIQVGISISPSGRRAVWSTNIQGEPARIEIADLDALDQPSVVDRAVAADEQVRAW